MKRNRVSIRTILAVLLCAVLTAGLGCMASAGADQSVAYIERAWSGSTVTSTQKVCSSYTTPSSNSSYEVSLEDDWYVLSSNVTYSKCLQITGNAKIILCDGKTLTANGIYIQQGKTLTIYAQQGGTGAISSTSDNGAGIGGLNNMSFPPAGLKHLTAKYLTNGLLRSAERMALSCANRGKRSL